MGCVILNNNKHRQEKQYDYDNYAMKLAYKSEWKTNITAGEPRWTKLILVFAIWCTSIISFVSFLDRKQKILNNKVTFSTPLKQQEDALAPPRSAATAIATTKTPPCALLFFGLVKDSFIEVTLPSIKANILKQNPDCDIFLHTYNLTQVPRNNRNGEVTDTPANASDAYSLTSHVNIENMDIFFDKREDFLNETRKNYHTGWGDCCQSHDNMIKQWHSIKGAWDLMTDHEQQNINNVTKHYQQIGLFRSDVYYVNPIDISDSEAAVPYFHTWGGYNDRIFYGNRENAAVWADRFAYSPIHKGDYHSESYLRKMMNHHNISVSKKPICVLRVRSLSRLERLENCWYSDSKIN